LWFLWKLMEGKWKGKLPSLISARCGFWIGLKMFGLCKLMLSFGYVVLNCSHKCCIRIQLLQFLHHISKFNSNFFLDTQIQFLSKYYQVMCFMPQYLLLLNLQFRDFAWLAKYFLHAQHTVITDVIVIVINTIFKVNASKEISL